MVSIYTDLAIGSCRWKVGYKVAWVVFVYFHFWTKCYRLPDDQPSGRMNPSFNSPNYEFTELRSLRRIESDSHRHANQFAKNSGEPVAQLTNIEFIITNRPAVSCTKQATFCWAAKIVHFIAQLYARCEKKFSPIEGIPSENSLWAIEARLLRKFTEDSKLFEFKSVYGELFCIEQCPTNQIFESNPDLER